jgi:hypothetical protein
LKNMKKVIFSAIIVMFAATLLMQNSTDSYAKKDVKNAKAVENINRIMTDGAGDSGKVPAGLLKAKGIGKKLQRTYETSTPEVVEETENSDVNNEDETSNIIEDENSNTIEDETSNIDENMEEDSSVEEDNGDNDEEDVAINSGPQIPGLPGSPTGV